MRRALPTALAGVGAVGLAAGMADAVRGRRVRDRLGTPGGAGLVWVSPEQHARLVALRRRRRVDAVLATAGALLVGAVLGRAGARPARSRPIPLNGVLTAGDG